MSSSIKRIAIVTGASSGIGRASVVRFAEQGIRVVANARRQERLLELEQELNGGEKLVCSLPGDAADPSVITEMFRTAKREFGHDADIVVVNAGRGLGGPVSTADLSQLEDVLRINVVGATRLVQESARVFLQQAESGGFPKRTWDIVIVGSTVGRHISPFSAVYGATKFGVNSLAEAARRELGPKGIRVTLVEPGVVLSEFQDVAGYDAALQQSFKDRFGPLLVPDDVARSIAFVVSQPPHVHVNDIMIRSTRQDYP